MGQKVNPHGYRVGVIKDWDSRWFANKSTFGDTLVEDYNIREFIQKRINTRTKNPDSKSTYAGVAKIEIERFSTGKVQSLHSLSVRAVQKSKNLEQKSKSL